MLELVGQGPDPGGDPVEPDYPGITADYDPAELTGYSDNDAITNFEDAEGNYDLNTVRSSPLYKASPTGFNGNPAIYFDGIDDECKNTSAGTFAWSADNAKTWYAVFRCDSFDADTGDAYQNQSIFHVGARYSLSVHGSGSSGYVEAWNSDGSYNDKVNIAISTGVTYVACMRHDGVTLKLKVNVINEGSIASGVTVTGNADGSMGEYWTNDFHGHIARLITCNQVHTDVERDACMSFLMTKYGVS